MNKIYAPFLVLGLLTLLLNSCYSPQAVVRVSPESDENVFWHNGQAIAEQKQDSIIARAAFSHANKNYLIFDVEVFNEGKASILVTPEVMQLSSPNGQKVRAANPEQVLLSMEMNQSRQNANAKNAAIVGGVIAVGAIVAAVALDDDSGDNNDEVDYIDDYTTLDATVDILSTVAWGLSFRQDPILSNAIEAFPNPATFIFWEDIALRRTTLRPGEHIRGLVAFPRIDHTSSLDVILPIEQLNFTFKFGQRLHQP